jgi:hypothetical protein
MIELIPPERFAQVQQALREMEPQQRPEVVNAEAVAAIGATRRLVYRGRVYEVAPVSFRDGQRLQSISRALDAAGSNEAATDAELDALVTSAVDLFHRLVRPRSHRWRRNPFRGASEREVGQLLLFFHSCRFRSGVRHDTQPAGSSRPR